MRPLHTVSRTVTLPVVGMLALGLLAGCSGAGSSRAVQAASQASAAAAAQCPGDKQPNVPYGGNNAPISAKSAVSSVSPQADLIPYAVAGFDSWFALAGADRQWHQGHFAPARLERVAQATANPIASVTLDAHALGVPDAPASDPASAYAVIDEVSIGSKAIYARWLQYADKKLAQQRLVAVDRCTLTVMATADVTGATEQSGSEQIAYDAATNSVWVAADGTLKRFDGTTLAPLTDVDVPARVLAAAGGAIWASTGDNEGLVVKIDPKTGTSTPAPTLSTGDQSIARVQHAGDQVYVAMTKQLVQVTADGTPGKTWPLTANLGATVAGVAGGETWVMTNDGLHGLTTSAALVDPSYKFETVAVTATSANVWAITSDLQLLVYAS